MAVAYKESGEALFSIDRKRSLEEFQKAFDLFVTTKDTSEIISMTNWMAYIHNANQNPEKMGKTLGAIKPLVNNLEQEGQFPQALISYWNLQGWYHSNKGAFAEKLNCDKKALLVSEQQPEVDSSSLLILYQNLAAAYDGINDCATAISYGEMALTMIRDSITANKLTGAKILYTLAHQYSTIKQYERADSLLLKAERLLQTFDNKGKTELDYYLGTHHPECFLSSKKSL